MPVDPAVSIVIPTFNRAHMVAKAIDTALNQTVPCEVIVSDHGSTDNTPDVVSRYGARVKYIRRDVDHGPFFCWLDGIINAHGDYIHITHDDDWVDETFIEKSLRVFKTDCAFTFTSVEIHYEDGNVRPMYEDLYETGVYQGWMVEKFLLNSMFTISPSCAVFRKKDVLQAIQVDGVPMSRHRYRGAGPDLLMFLLPLLEYPRFGFVNEKLAYFSGHSNSITVDAIGSEGRSAALEKSYEEAKKYYLLLREDRLSDLGNRLLLNEKGTQSVNGILGRVKQLISRTS